MRHWQSRGEDKRPKQGRILIYCYKKYYLTVFVTIKWSKTHVQPFVLGLFVNLLLSRGHRSLLWVYDSQTRVLSRHVVGEVPSSKTCNFPQEFCHVGNYNLMNIEAKSNANYSTGICYLLSEVLIFVDKCTESPNFSNLHSFNKVHVSNRKPEYRHIHATQSITIS